MKSLNVLLSIVCLSTSVVSAQTRSKTNDVDALQKQVLLSDLKSLAVEIPKLDGPLARALADAEIADAAWSLDQNWARNLLKEAYQLTYPSEEEQRRIGPEPPGTPPRPPTPIGRARDEVRRRILNVARRDKVFAEQLIADSTTHVSKDDRQMMYAQLTRVALEEGDYASAVQSIQQNMAIDPTQLMLVQLVNDLAIKDRPAADKLILEFIASLATAQLANGKLGRARGQIVLRWLVFPNSFFPDPNRRVPSPGPEVMKSYVRYVLETLTAMQQTEPGSLPRERSFLLTAWLPLNQYVPELRERFVQLETLSRTPGKDASLPTKSNEELDQENFSRKQREALNNDGPNEPSIDLMITQEDFETARKLIDKLPDGERKTRFTEQVNTKQAISLAKKGDLLAAQNLAERLMTVGAMLEVYPAIVERYAGDKDQLGTSAAVHSAMKQLKRVKGKPPSASVPFGMPSEFMPTASERDGIVSTLGKLAKAVLPIDTLLGAQVVDEMVETANRSALDTSLGRTGFDSDLFKNLAAKDEVRARSAAENFKDRLRRIVAVAAIYQWKATELERRAPKKAARVSG
ncbi:MAG TPA: hypothetical protein VFS76_25845 [Pyrinomonadaceae bacterium]|nr:hypothetical protein [Pyrinomonadaceae bacterium]